ncbi:proteasome 26S subunit [Capsaspora owczarzaki ATCC 30864]|uniref:Proteasome 26S subunit n=1 Tax=Capsaspora owczarzaki (strain ATCC 30864) TaxID=595528 RepID=A0A0D2U010_CAPO3|nr:proteasome 26S subunit [Capsaspora owczarzaki ATCC 30864]KJE88511.1 proteasome 26S subunit [Capsaspora owczarzaki ATCC 30864]|eukprot:XP_004365030.1 proteasome 26S subunit [Capsaspora owczarzaki ATCC 30864]
MVAPVDKKEVAVNPVSSDDPAASKKAPAKPAPVELSEEDKQLKEELEMLVQRLKDPDTALHGPALEALRTQIRSATSSMTSVPKPLKFLRDHYAELKSIHTATAESANKRVLADIISVLAMTSSEEGSRDSLHFKLIGSGEELGSWGHEYVRHLAGEIGVEYEARNDADESTDDLVALAKEIVPFNMKHNAEAEACDLLMEIERLDLLSQYVDEQAYQRVCLYLVSCVTYVPEPEDAALLRTALEIFRKFERYPAALRLAAQLNDLALIKEVYESCPDSAVKKQLALILGRHHIFIEGGSIELNDLISNTNLSSHFLSLARELDIMDPKTPEDIYKSHLEPSRGAGFGAGVDSARQNLASTFVNAFVNAGFGVDKLLTDDGHKWIYKNKEHGMMSAAASLGMLYAWDVDGGLAQIDKYLYTEDEYIKAGALLACGIVNTGVRNEADPALALLSDYLTDKKNIVRTGAIMGFGLAYAGSARAEFVDLLTPALNDTQSSMEVVGVAALALGLIFVGTCDGEVTSAILQTMMERTDAQLQDTYARFLAVGLGLTCLGKQEAADATLAALQAVPPPFGRLAQVLVEACAYTGTGNVLKVQSMLHICSEHFDKEKKQDDTHQSIAVLAIALIAMGEDIGSEMALQTMNHLLQYGEPVIRRSVPVALALLCVSNPKLTVLDTLSKLSHDNDLEVAASSIFGMGLVGAGTNNSRIAAMLRGLASFYQKEPNQLFMVRIAQGLLHFGKGTMSLSPYHSDRSALSPVAAGGLIAVLVSCLDATNVLLGKSHYFLYYLVTAMHPRMLMTFDENMKPLPVTVRVGQAVDVVGQAGKPKTITGFQTHTTPVLLAYGERAEVATEEYIPLSSLMEGLVILRKNPDYVAAAPEEDKSSKYSSSG